MTDIRGSSTARFSPPADELHLPGAGKVTHFGQGVLRSPVMPMVKKTQTIWDFVCRKCQLHN